MFLNRKKQGTNLRLNIVLFGAIFFAMIIGYRLFSVQIMKHDYYIALATEQHQMVQQLLPKRGELFFQEYGNDDVYPAAINQKLHFLYAVPKSVKDDKKVADQLITIFYMEEYLPPLERKLNQDEKDDPKVKERRLEEEKKKREEQKKQELEKIKTKLSNKTDLYEPIRHKLNDNQKALIDELHIAGLYFAPEDFRFYPEGQLAAHVLGFVGFDENTRVGRYGVEGYYNEQLEGREGLLKAEKDTEGRWISIGNRTLDKPDDGDNLVLTVDRVVQYQVEKRLKDAVEKFKADSGSVIVMNPKTGAIIAIANEPSFNPNTYSEVDDISVYGNQAIRELYEPGSVFKPINMAAALDAGLVNPDTTYEDTGSVKIDTYTIQNADKKAYGEQTMTQVLEKSLNLGMIFVMNKLGIDKVHEYLVKFGLNDMTGIDLDTEGESNLKDADKTKEIDLATMGFGQGIAVTPLQLISAFSVLANDGKLMKPYIIDKVISPSGDEKITEPEVVREVISPRTAQKISAMLVSVVDKGFGAPAKVKGYRIAGKTGTAQVPNKNKKGYDPNQKIASFAGFAPFEDPQFAVLIKLDNPKAAAGAEIWAATTAAPVFKDIASFLLTYYQIPPNVKE